ncbi:hypothetical protein [Streptomyces rimosus]|uniref:hypothetical protein n=1 Tax=Streptomyces rimosus TaxID=1927 RepID=UPI0007C537E7|nr:hypothetical protein [Streptomyces rimosus]
MGSIVPFLIVFGFFAAVLALCARFAVHVRRRGAAGGAMSAALASYEEAFRATSHQAHVEIRAQAEREAPVLSPDGPWRRGPGGAGQTGAEGRRPLRPRSRRPRRAVGRWADRLRRGR